jgi:hypothetical protein
MTPRASPSRKILLDDRKENAVAFLKAAVAYHQSLGVKVVRVVTDNVLRWER